MALSVGLEAPTTTSQEVWIAAKPSAVETLQ
jgi:hypothetical protein